MTTLHVHLPWSQLGFLKKMSYLFTVIVVSMPQIGVAVGMIMFYATWWAIYGYPPTHRLPASPLSTNCGCPTAVLVHPPS
jgi:hypothetical protein